mgnify:CR=1 FL=1
MKKTLSIGLLLTLISTASFADAYNKCKGCHGANGEKKALNKSLIMKDMTKAEIKDSLIGYQNGTYGRAMKGLMVGQVRNLSMADIEAIANKIGK